MRINKDSLRAVRERSGYSIRQLAEASGVSRSSISDIERGVQEPSPATVRNLAQALLVPTTALLLSDEEAVA